MPFLGRGCVSSQLMQHVRVFVQHPEQVYHRRHGLCLSTFIAAEGVVAAARQLRRLRLRDAQLVPDAE